MKHKFMGKRLGSGFLALALVLGLLLGSMGSVFAGDTYPYVGESAEGENQPTLHGYRVEDLMQWSPETDPYAEMLRAQVPLQNRNAAFAATQANPGLTPEAQYLTLTGDYGNSFFNADAYTNEFSTHVFNFWQYVDQYASWHGMPSVGTPEELNDVKDERNATDGNAWKRRNFEFGLINLPNPAYTNAAHKNGVLSLGCMFQPRAYQNFQVMLYKDENGRYPVADKFVEIAKYYGFDGYFFNMEGRSFDSATREELKAFIAQMRKDGMYIQWYNAGGFSTNMLTSATANNYENATLYANSIFQEYGTAVAGDDRTVPYGLDKYQVAFNGFEAGANRWSNSFSRLLKDGVMNASIASLGTDFVQTGLEKTIRQDEETGYNLFSRELDEYQWMAFERERLWWTGNKNSRTTAVNAGLTGTASDVDARDFTGIADYIAERSVVRGSTFYTNFNTGHGLEYRLNGELSSSSEWSNINIQDILPTWQWWFETTGTKLSAEFDYGSKYRKVYYNGNEGEFGFDLIGAYNGGSSLAVYGDIDAENFMHLYKSALDVSKDSKMSITFRKGSEDEATMKLGLIFADNTDEVVKLDIANAAKKSDNWVTSVVDLSAYAGKQIAAFGLVFDGEATGYQMHIGQMRFTSGEDIVPETPTGFQIEKAFEDGEMTVSWNKKSYDEVKQYNIYALVGGQEMFLGGIYDENYYIKNVSEAIAEAAADYIESVTVSPKETDAVAGDRVDLDAIVKGYQEAKGQVTLVLKAVSEDGSESEGTMVTYNYDDAIKNVEVDNSTDGQLVLTWEGGAADVTVTTDYEKEARTWTASGTNGCTVTVPTGADADGAYVTIQVTQNGQSTTVDTRLPDKYCAPYDGRVYGSDGRLTQPMAADWHIIRYQVATNGERAETVEVTRGVGQGVTNDHAVFTPIPSTADGVYVWLEDYNGNVSEEVYVPNRLTVTVSFDDTAVQAGTTAQFTALVKNYEKDDSVVWSVSGNKSADTKIDENGLLTIAEEENANTITVTATSVEDTSASGSIRANVVPAYALKADASSAYKGESINIAVYYKGTKLPTEDYEWSVAPIYGSMAEGTKIENGVLTVAPNETANRLTVKATKDGTEYSMTITVMNLYGLEKNADSIYAGDTVTFSIKNQKTGETQDSKNYSWSVSSAYAYYGDISSADTKVVDGVLTIGEDETCTYIKVTATGADGAEFYTTLSVKPLYVLSPSNPTVAPGETQQFAIKNVKTDEAKPATDYTWAVTSPYAQWYGELAEGTKIDENGLLTLDANETCSYIQVTATDKTTGGQFSTNVRLGQKTQSVEEPASEVETEAPETVEVVETPIEEVLPTPAPDGEDPVQKVIWTVEGAKSEATTIDEDGVLTIGIDEPDGQLLVTATSALDETKFDTAVVNVKARAKYTVTVVCGEHGKVEPGTGEYYEGTEVEYTFTPDEGYELDKVLVNGQEVTVKDNKGTLTVTGDTKLEVSFKEIKKPLDPSKPSTGDTFDAGMVVVLAISAAAVLATGAYLFLRKKHN